MIPTGIRQETDITLKPPPPLRICWLIIGLSDVGHVATTHLHKMYIRFGLCLCLKSKVSSFCSVCCRSDVGSWLVLLGYNPLTTLNWQNCGNSLWFSKLSTVRMTSSNLRDKRDQICHQSSKDLWHPKSNSCKFFLSFLESLFWQKRLECKRYFRVCKYLQNSNN